MKIKATIPKPNVWDREGDYIPPQNKVKSALALIEGFNQEKFNQQHQDAVEWERDLHKKRFIA